MFLLLCLSHSLTHTPPHPTPPSIWTNLLQFCLQFNLFLILFCHHVVHSDRSLTATTNRTNIFNSKYSQDKLNSFYRNNVISPLPSMLRHGDSQNVLSFRSTNNGRTERRLNQMVVDPNAMLDQDPRCDPFIHSVLIDKPRAKQHNFDPTSSVIDMNFFNVPHQGEDVSYSYAEYTFHTPNHPNYFPSSIECIKIITAPSKDYQISLNFRGTFELEPRSSCLLDYLEVRDGYFGYSPLLGRFCGRRLPNKGQSIQSSGQHMWLRFRSDETIPHRGFQAVYKFVSATNMGSPDVYRFQYRKDMELGEMWNLNEKFLLENMNGMTPADQRLPIEASFDIRAPNGSQLMIHVYNITVPRQFAWSCKPKPQLPMRTACPDASLFYKRHQQHDLDEPALTNLPDYSIDSKLDPVRQSDPISRIDGKHTIVEVYPHRTNSPYLPPCGRIRQFCNRSVGVEVLTMNHESERDFYIPVNRAVIRLIIASPAMQPKIPQPDTKRLTQPGFAASFLQRIKREQSPSSTLIFLPQMPSFQFHITALKTAQQGAVDPCGPSWVACDPTTCIPASKMCDTIYNCPLWQDEGGHCRQLLGPSGDEAQKELEKKEDLIEQKRAMQLHAAILGSLGILLILITVTCILTTIRRRKKERGRHTLKLNKSNKVAVPQSSTPIHPSISRFHTVLSSGGLLDEDHLVLTPQSNTRPSNTMMKSNSAHSQSHLFDVVVGGQRVPKQNTNTEWVSTESLNAPLLWQRKRDEAEPHSSQTHRWKNTVQTDVPRPDSMTPHIHKGNIIKSPLRMRTRVRPMDVVISTSPNRYTTPPTKPHTTITIGSNLHVSVSPMHSPTPSHIGRPKSSVIEISGSRSVKSGPLIQNDLSTGGPHTIVRNLEPESNFHRMHTVTEPVGLWEIQHQKRSWISGDLRSYPMERHVADCKVINRTQSWGGGLRLAGVQAFCNGEWEITQSVQSSNGDGESPVQLSRVFEPPETGMENYPERGKLVNGDLMRIPMDQESSFDEVSPKGRREFKPPSAKRPRMIVSEATPMPSAKLPQNWIPSNCDVVDTDEDLSGGTAMINEYGSVLSYPMTLSARQTTRVQPYNKSPVGRWEPSGAMHSPRDLSTDGMLSESSCSNRQTSSTMDSQVAGPSNSSEDSEMMQRFPSSSHEDESISTESTDRSNTRRPDLQAQGNNIGFEPSSRVSIGQRTAPHQRFVYEYEA